MKPDTELLIGAALPDADSEPIQIEDAIKMLLKRSRVVKRKRGYLVMQEAAGGEPVSQTAVPPSYHLDQIIRPQPHGSAEIPHDDKAITGLDGLVH